MHCAKLFDDYECIKKGCPTYRFGQHIVNSLGLRDCQELFYEVDDDKAALMLISMCTQYNWEISDLPEFNKNAV